MKFTVLFFRSLAYFFCMATSHLCPVLLSNDGIPLTPNSLIQLSQSQSTFSIKISDPSNSDAYRLLVFRPNNELFGANLLTNLSSSNNSICHFISNFDNGESNALSICSADAITGIFKFGSYHFSLSTNQNKFVLSPQNGQGCEWPKHRQKRSIANTPEYYADYLDGRMRYVELAFVADNSIYKKYDSNEVKVHDRLHAVANIVNSLYVPLNIRVTLVWAEIWTDGNKVEVTEDSDKTLLNFLFYRRSIMKDPKTHHDNAQLVTEVTFLSNVIGKAYKGTMCSYDYSGGVIMDHHSNAASVAATSAHEMGHSFGMEHDPKGCKCPSDVCIMNASNGGYASLSHWSSCSLEYLEKSLIRKMDYCLHNVPKTAFGGAKCGNGIVEEGEDCDCGNTTVCPNKCCVASTCKLAKEAICASGDCCDISTCQPKKKATVCRPQISSCDLPEFCDGITGDCPADFFVQNGLKCPDAPEDYCYEGECGSRTAQCQMIWGPSGVDSAKACYNYNLQSNIYGNCGHDPGTGIYTPCQKENTLCGRLHCQSDTEKPVFGDASTVTAAYNHFRLRDGKDVTCRVIQTTYTGGRKKHDPGMVQDGAVCGKDKLCIDSKCTNKSEVTNFAPKCDPQNCNSKGICNSAGNCHCAYGYGGTACDLPGYGGSVNSGPSTDQAFNALLWLGVLLAFICIAFCGATWYYKKRKNKWLPKEMWDFTKEKLNIQAMLVPVRKAPPPPGGRHAGTRQDPNSAWGDNPNQLRVGAGRPVVPPPLVTIPNPNQPHMPMFNNDPAVSYFAHPPSSQPFTSPVTSSPSVNPVKHNRSGRRAQAPGFPAPKPPETKALNPSSRQPGDSSSDENTLTSPDLPPPVPPHRDLSSHSLPAKKEKPKLPVKPPVASKPISNVNVKNLAAKFDVKNSNVDLG